jgi:hypothetical protein
MSRVLRSLEKADQARSLAAGTGAYEAWKGSGQMEMKYDPSDKRKHPTRGRERNTGTVRR